MYVCIVCLYVCMYVCMYIYTSVLQYAYEIHQSETKQGCQGNQDINITCGPRETGRFRNNSIQVIIDTSCRLFHVLYDFLELYTVFNKQCVVYHFSCDLCDADYVGTTARHLHQRIAEHKNSAIGRHFLEAHGNNNFLRENQFTVLRKCQSKFDCLVFEMLFIKKLKPNLNIQTDSIRAKLFV